MANQEKVYCGTGFEKVFNNGSSVLNVTFYKDDVEKLLANKRADGAISITVSKRRNTENGKATHYCTINQFDAKSPASRPAMQIPVSNIPKAPMAIEQGDLPY